MLMSIQKKSFVPAVMAAAIAVSVVYSQDLSKENALEILRNESLGRGLASVKDSLKKSTEESMRRVEFYKMQNPDSAVHTADGELFDVLPDGTPVYISTDNVEAAKTTQTDELHAGSSLGLNLSGANELIGMWDEGPVRASHEIFTARAVILKDSIVADPLYKDTTISDHATHVGGTLVGNIHANGGLCKGMAPNASLVSYGWTSDTYEAAKEVEENNLLISNHSYGFKAVKFPRNSWGKYLSYAVDTDKLHYASPYYLQVWSAGNDRDYANWMAPERGGYDILTGHSVAKNNLVVGAVIPTRVHGDPKDIIMTSFSSWGPTDDGRIKPDISGMGKDLLSSRARSNSAYGLESGTSMASPNVAGSLILLQEYHRREFHSYLKAATIKGLALHTADEAGEYPGPDYSFGWGLLNMKRAVTLLQAAGDSTVVEERTLDNNEIYSFKAMKHSADQPLKVSICWTDPAGEKNTNDLNNDATPLLVNDLDLRVTDGVIEHFPWKLNPAIPSAAATKGDNLVDNIEVVEVENGFAGQVYTINVSHKNVLSSNKQDYTVIVSGGQRVEGACNLPQWSNTTTYLKGDVIEYNGISYTAQQWTRGTMPQVNSSWGPWEFNRECNADADIPMVTISSSATGGEITGLRPITLQADIASEVGVKHVLLKVTNKDGIEAITPEKGSLYTVDYTPTVYGKHTFEFIAIDDFGRKGTEKIAVNVYEETSVPSISFTSHNMVDTVYLGVKNRITLNAEATIGRDREVYLSSPDYSPLNRVKLSDVNAPLFAYDLSIPLNETAADMKLVAEIVEKNGDIAAAQTLNLKIRANAFPDVQMISSTDTLLSSFDPILLRANATDTDGTVEKMFVRLSNGQEKEMVKLGDEYQFTYLPELAHYIDYVQIYAVDNVGAVGDETNITVRTSSMRENTAPTIQFRSVAGSKVFTSVFSPLDLRFFTKNDHLADGPEYLVKSEVLVNGVKQKEKIFDKVNAANVQLYVTPTKFGTNTLTIRTMDERGLWGEHSADFTVIGTAKILSVTPAEGSTVQVNAGDSLDVVVETNSDDATVTKVTYDLRETTADGVVSRTFEGDPTNNHRLRFLPQAGNSSVMMRIRAHSEFHSDTKIHSFEVITK